MKWLLGTVLVVALVVVFATPAGQQMLAGLLAPEAAKSAAVADDDDDDDDVPSRLHHRDGVLGIELPPATQALSGLRTQPADPMQYRPEIEALAEVVDIKPLLDLRSRYRALRADIRISEVKLRQSRASHERLQLLHKDDANISTSQLEQSRAELDSAAARLAAQRQQVASLRDEVTQTWGGTLADWVLDGDSDNGHFQQLLQRQEVLLKVSLGRDQSMPSTTRVIYVNRSDDRLNARKAYYVSVAARTDPSLQGETYYFRSGADKLRVGMRIRTWIPVTGEIIDGVHIPAEAVVWQAGQPWVYLQDGETFFYRRVLDEPVRQGRGWFVPAEQIAAGERIVTRGAQMLLSEEYRWQIPDEDDD
ncbi:hypothetical protein J2T55_000555 [Methylohalomonas lacus]|uniref:Uncharacterized protein n=1 Tax=Methylohalomonas lacus TaxID=398773 RepID=A0AAE3HK21_9GAMM|nr:hypothetical protein [Methylohalomonas lacus]MCS3902551.1 hypothetical protein [Methylohalomonas lacus]